MKFAVGDVVRFDLSASHGTGPGTGTVIGYSFPDVCVVATETTHGMPINEDHCRRIGADPAARGFRARYEGLYAPLLPVQNETPLAADSAVSAQKTGDEIDSGDHTLSRYFGGFP